MLREIKYSDLTPKQCRILSAMYFKCILYTGEIIHSISKNSTFLIYFKNNKPIGIITCFLVLFENNDPHFDRILYDNIYFYL